VNELKFVDPNPVVWIY